MEQIAILFVFAVITEALVNLFFEDIPQSKVKKYLAYAIGVTLTIVWKAGILASLEIVIPNTFAAYIDYIMTGIFCSRGSNFLHQLFETLKAYRTSKNIIIPPSQ